MGSSYNEHIINAVSKFIENTDKSNVVFIKHCKSFYIEDKDILNKVANNNNNIQLLYYKYDNSKLQGPYEPLLGWIKDLYLKYFKEESIDDFLDNCNVYYLHKSIFKSFIKSGKCVREEEIIISEIKYEQEMFIKSLCSILSYISNKIPLIIILNELHIANSSTIEFVKAYTEEKRKNKILFIASYNEAYKRNNGFSDWESLLKSIKINHLLVDCSLDEETDFLEEEKYHFFPKDNEFIEYIIQINNMIVTLAYEQALYYLEIIYDTKVIEKKEISFKGKQKFLQLYALANLYLGNTSKTLLLCDESNELCKVKKAVKDENLNYLFQANYILGIAQICKGQYYIGEEYSEKCLKIAEKEKDNLLIFKSRLLKYTALFRGWKGVFLCDVNYSVEEDFLDELKKHNYINHLAYIYIVENESKILKSSTPIKSILDNRIFMEGINIAKKIKNDFFLYLAYNKVIVISSIQNKLTLVEEYYDKALKVAIRLKDKEKKADVLNGLGYNLLRQEKYVEAADKFNKAIEVLYNIGSINEVAEVLYNMGINAFVAGKFDESKELLLNCLKMIEYLKIGCIRVCNITKIYGFIALDNYYTKNYFDCNYYLKKMEKILSHLLDPKENPSYTLWDDDLYLYYLLSGIMFKLQKNYSEAQESFEKAEIHMKKSTGSFFYSVILLAIEKNDLYEKIGKRQKGKEILKLAIDFYKKNKCYKKVSILQKIYNNDLIKIDNESLGLKSVNINLLFDISRRIGSEEELNEERKELSFILMWQDVLSKKYISEEELIKNSMEVLKNNFFVEKILYIHISDNMNGKIIYNNIDKKLNVEDIKTIICYFMKSGREFVICREDENISIYKDIINIFGKNKVFSIIGIPIFSNAVLKDILIAYIPVHNNFLENKFRLTERHLYIFKYIFKQLLDALNKMRINKKIEDINKRLSKIAITDILTGIYNRQGFKRILEKNNKILTILYIDLDNFKLYNDSYGHDVGDFVLVYFSKILNKVIKDNGYAVRYGGDEFILVLENGSNEKGIKLAKVINSFINNEDFYNALKAKIGDKIYKGEKISCSIGIATSKGKDAKSVMDAIINADKALYKIKNNGKGKYKEWINEKTQE